MSAIPRAGTFNRTRYFLVFTNIDKCQYIILITMFALFIIKIHTQEIALNSIQNNIDSYNITSFRILSFKMLVNIVILQTLKLPVRALCTLIFSFITELTIPLIQTYRLISRFTTCFTISSLCKYIFAPFE